MIGRSLLLLVFALATVPVQSKAASRDSLVAYQSCDSGALRIELNVQNQSNKTDLLRALKIFAQHPELRFTPVVGTNKKAAFEVTLQTYCETDECAESFGWKSVQTKLKALRGVVVQCAPYDGSADMPAAPIQAPPPKAGGIGGSN